MRLLLAWVMAVAGVAAEPGVEANPDLSGAWQRNAVLSQDAGAIIVEAVGAHDRDVGDLPRQQFRDRLLRLAKAAQTFEIEQSPTEMKVVAAADAVRIFYPDGTEHRRTSSEGLAIRASSRWIQKEFVVDQKLEDGDRIVERFFRDGEGHLVHQLQWTSKRLKAPLSVRTVYDVTKRAE